MIYIYIWATLHYNPDSLDCKVIVHYSHQPNVIHVPATWLEFSNMRDHVSKSGIGCPTIYRSLDWVISIAIILWHGFIGRSLSELPSAKLPWSFLLFRKQGSQVWGTWSGIPLRGGGRILALSNDSHHDPLGDDLAESNGQLGWVGWMCWMSKGDVCYFPAFPVFWHFYSSACAVL